MDEVDIQNRIDMRRREKEIKHRKFIRSQKESEESGSNPIPFRSGTDRRKDKKNVERFHKGGKDNGKKR